MVEREIPSAQMIEQTQKKIADAPRMTISFRGQEEFPDPWVVLGLDPAELVTEAAVRNRFRALMPQFHPDAFQDEKIKQSVLDISQEISRAKEILLEVAARAGYSRKSFKVVKQIRAKESRSKQKEEEQVVFQLFVDEILKCATNPEVLSPKSIRQRLIELSKGIKDACSDGIITFDQREDLLNRIEKIYSQTIDDAIEYLEKQIKAKRAIQTIFKIADNILSSISEAENKKITVDLSVLTRQREMIAHILFTYWQASYRTGQNFQLNVSDIQAMNDSVMKHNDALILIGDWLHLAIEVSDQLKVAKRNDAGSTNVPLKEVPKKKEEQAKKDGLRDEIEEVQFKIDSAQTLEALEKIKNELDRLRTGKFAFDNRVTKTQEAFRNKISKLFIDALNRTSTLTEISNLQRKLRDYRNNFVVFSDENTRLEALVQKKIQNWFSENIEAAKTLKEVRQLQAKLAEYRNNFFIYSDPSTKLEFEIQEKIKTLFITQINASTTVRELQDIKKIADEYRLNFWLFSTQSGEVESELQSKIDDLLRIKISSAQNLADLDKLSVKLDEYRDIYLIRYDLYNRLRSILNKKRDQLKK